MDNVKMPFQSAVTGAGNIADKFCGVAALLEGCQAVTVAGSWSRLSIDWDTLKRHYGD